MDYAAQPAQPQPVGEMPPYMQAENAPQEPAATDWSATPQPAESPAQPQAVDPVDVLASNQHPLTQPTEAQPQETPQAPETVSSEAVDSFYADSAEPAAADMSAPQPVMQPEASAQNASLGDKVSALLVDIQALESENAQLKAQLQEVESLRAKETLLKDSAEKLQSIVDAMRG